MLFARSEAWFASVQKASKQDYEFSGKWTLPGGMIRATSHPYTLRTGINEELGLRAYAEAGLKPRCAAPIATLGPIVTSYTVADVRRFTLVAAFEQHLVSRPPLTSSDRSIQAARWMPCSADFWAFAPGNCVIIGHMLWPHLEIEHQKAARNPIVKAVETCADWSRQVGISPPPPPWAPHSVIEKWSQSWPGGL